MHDDDSPIGSVLSRRDALRLLGVAGTAVLAGCAPAAPEGADSLPATAAAQPTAATGGAPPGAVAEPTAAALEPTTAAAADALPLPSCVVRPELTEGPYFVDEVLNRSDIRVDTATGAASEGVPFELSFRVSRVEGEACLPLEGSQVDIWHCDARGVYSGVNDLSRGSTQGQDFLRGYQITSADGVARFTTIYPGWYPGRAVHIHFKIRTPAGGQAYDFTSQLFFDEALSQAVYTQPPYTEQGAAGMPSNGSDGIFGQTDGQLLLNVTETAGGYAATFDIGLLLS